MSNAYYVTKPTTNDLFITYFALKVDNITLKSISLYTNKPLLWWMVDV
jgi:hypothetical protein